MHIKRLTLTALSLALFSGCSVSQINPMVFRPPRLFSLHKNTTRIEHLIDRQRMEKNMAALTGKIPVTQDTVIPERGTVEGRNLTRLFLTNYLESLGYEVEKHEYRPNGINILTRLMAEEPTDEYILVGAHMDSVRNAGADDNGSGSTAVLEVATVLPQLKGRKVNLIFAWFDEEEKGLIGSSYLAEDYRNKKVKITTVHTVDMMGWDADKDKTVELARPDGILWDYYKMVNQTHGFDLPLDRTSTGSSDHVAFHQEGFDSLCLSEEWTSRDTTPHYHKKTDTYETVNFEFLTTGTQLLIAAVGDLSLKIPPPKNIQLIPHDRFPGREREFHQHPEGE